VASPEEAVLHKRRHQDYQLSYLFVVVPAVMASLLMGGVSGTSNWRELAPPFPIEAGEKKRGSRT
jgi:hypothetical protein